MPRLPLFHDSWAGLFIALSLTLRAPNRYISAIVFGLLAALVREMALAYLLLMLACALWERSWREAIGWIMAIACVCVSLSLHAYGISSYIQADDLVSQGWDELGGWFFYLSTIYSSSGLIFLPKQVGYGLVRLSIFGWLAWKSVVGLRVFGLILGYAIAVMLFARPGNLYWSLLVAPFILAGAVFAAPGVKALLSNILRAKKSSGP